MGALLIGRIVLAAVASMGTGMTASNGRGPIWVDSEVACLVPDGGHPSGVTEKVRGVSRNCPLCRITRDFRAQITP